MDAMLAQEHCIVVAMVAATIYKQCIATMLPYFFHLKNCLKVVTKIKTSHEKTKKIAVLTTNG